jgi:hypothetical protein
MFSCNRLRDAEGNLKTLRHKFAVYFDDICACADSLEELYELFEALMCCCKIESGDPGQSRQDEV